MRKQRNIQLNENLLKEELKRFNAINGYNAEEGLINEFNFHISEDFYDTDDELLEADEEGGDEDIDAAIDDVASELEGGDEEIAPEDDEETDSEEGDDEELDMGDDEELDLGGEEESIDGEDPMDDSEEDMDLGGEDMEDTSDDVEIDVTELVNSSEEAKQSSDMVNQKMEDLMGQFNQLSAQLEKMNGLSAKIDDLEHDIETRMPTPEEKLEMRSLSSYPYNIKLTDYWADKEGQYDVMDGEAENAGKPKEYVLTSDEVDSDYSEIDVKKSLENPYEEEDMY